MSACRRYSSKETRKQPTRRKESDISEKELYRQKRQAELDAWQADIEKMKAKASEASPDAQIEINEQGDALQLKVEEGKAKLTEVAEAGDDGWDSVRSAFSDAAAKFKD